MKRTKPYGFTPHEVAVAYAKKRWSGAGNREAWYSKLRYSGKFTLPKEKPLTMPLQRQ
jgi:hypothetical protein